MLLVHLVNLLIHNTMGFVITILVIILPLFMSIAFHEWAHGFVAYKFGDPTPKIQGRLSLNPLAHLDPVGTLMLFIIGIGWAKPIILNPQNYPGRTQQMLVALAGPATNLLLAVIFSVILVFIELLSPYKTGDVYKTVLISMNIVIRINLLLTIVNMIPIPPLDGSRIIGWMLPRKLEVYYLSLEPYGFFLLILILFSGGFTFIVRLVDFIQLNLLNLVKNFVISYIL